MRWVIDASSTAAYLLGEGSAAENRAMVGEAHAPSLVDVEVTHTLRGLVLGAGLTPALAEEARGDLAQLALRRHPDRWLLERAWTLRDVCTTYDGLYAALAEALDATLITRDARLARGLAGRVEVHLST